MASKQDMGLYPQAGDLPNAPPNYDDATAPQMSQGVPQMQQPQQTVHIIQNAPPQPLGPKPCRVTCPSCHQVQVSKTRYVSNTKTHIIALILLATTCCCCIPYCFDSCKSAEHNCSNCGAYLGKYES